ncbi:hypothetical protein DL98DRAFT_626451 [Cadophora sp. DSE1049]|nr:hypothetical protein DL98DRAFT_626451 [Cadophora sp. DSE1049]
MNFLSFPAAIFWRVTINASKSQPSLSLRILHIKMDIEIKPKLEEIVKKAKKHKWNKAQKDLESKVELKEESKVESELDSKFESKPQIKSQDDLKDEPKVEVKPEDRPDRTFATLDTEEPIPFVVDPIHGVMRLSTNPHFVVLTISGRTKGFTSAIGIYFGDGSRRNMSAKIPDGEVNAHQGAELYAVTIALETIQCSALTENLKLIIIQVGSPYILTAMNKKCWELLPTGFQHFEDRGYYRHASVIGTLHKACTEFEAAGIGVKFWQIRMMENWAAVNLAKAALGDL